MRFAADENFNGLLYKGLRSRLPDLDIIRIQDTDQYGASDPDLLEWLAKENRILLTHDVQTIPEFAYKRVKAGLPMPGVIEVNQEIAFSQALDELQIVIGAGEPEDFANLVRYIPL